MASRMAPDRLRLHQRRRAAAEKDRRHRAGPACAPPWPRSRRLKARANRVLVDGGVADMAVEVAIRAFRQAERPVHVDAEGRGRFSVLHWTSSGLRQISASLRKARARCDRPRPRGGRPCFSLARHLAEGAARGRRAGTSDRSRSRRRRAAARPGCRRPGPRIPRRGRRARPRTARRRNAPCAAPARWRRARCSQSLDRVPWPRRNPCLGPAQRAE